MTEKYAGNGMPKFNSMASNGCWNQVAWGQWDDKKYFVFHTAASIPIQCFTHWLYARYTLFLWLWL